MLEGALERLQQAAERNKSANGSLFDGTAPELTKNDVRMMAHKCMPQLIEACKKGQLIDINSIIKEYWENQFSRLTPEELLSYISQYALDDASGRFSKSDMELALRKYTNHDSLVAENVIR